MDSVKKDARINSGEEDTRMNSMEEDTRMNNAKRNARIKKWVNGALFIEQVKRFWAIPALSILAYVLFVVVNTYSRGGSGWDSAARQMVNLLSGNHAFMIFASVFFPLCAAAALFPHHFNSVSATAFSNFPVNKRQLFCTNLLAGAAMLLVPLFLLCLLILFPVSVEGSAEFSRWISNWSVHIWGEGTASFWRMQTVNTVPVVGGFFLRTALTLLFYFAMGVLAVSLTGNRVVALLVAGVIAFLPAALLGLAWVVADMYVFGFIVTGDFFISTVMTYMHPLLMGQVLTSNLEFIRGLTGGGMWPLYISYLLIMAAMLGVGAYACFRRKAERAGESVAFNPIKVVLIFLMSLAGMVAGGVFFIALLESRGALYFGFVLGFVITFFLAQMIAEKSFHIARKIKRLPIFAAAAAGLYILMLVITHGVLWGYITRVPHSNDIAGVYIFYGRPGNHWVEGDHFAFIRDRDIIEATRATHMLIIEERGTLRRHMWSDVTRSWRHTPVTGFPITYLLTDGTMITRSYTIPREYFERLGLLALSNAEAVILSNHPHLLDPSGIERITLRIPQAHTNREELLRVINELQSGVPSVMCNYFRAPLTIHDLDWLLNLLAHDDHMTDLLRYHGIYDTDFINRSIEIQQRVDIYTLAQALRLDTVATVRNERTQQLREPSGLLSWYMHINDTLPVIRVELHLHPHTEADFRWGNRRFISLREFDHTLAWLGNTHW